MNRDLLNNSVDVDTHIDFRANVKTPDMDRSHEVYLGDKIKETEIYPENKMQSEGVYQKENEMTVDKQQFRDFESGDVELRPQRVPILRKDDPPAEVVSHGQLYKNKKSSQ